MERVCVCGGDWANYREFATIQNAKFRKKYSKARSCTTRNVYANDVIVVTCGSCWKLRRNGERLPIVLWIEFGEVSEDVNKLNHTIECRDMKIEHDLDTLGYTMRDVT